MGLLNLIKSVKTSIFITVSLSLLAIVFSLLFANQSKILFDSASENLQISYIPVILLITFKILQFLSEQGDIYLRSMTRARLENILVYDTFKNCLRSNVIDLKKYHTGDKIYRISNDTSTVAESVASTIPIIIYAVILFLATSIYLFLQDARLTLVLCVIAPLTIFMSYLYSKFLIPAEKKTRKAASHIMSYIQEHLQFHDLLISLNSLNIILGHIKVLQNKYIVLIKKRLKLIIGIESLSEISLIAAYLFVIVWGINGIAKQIISIGELIVFLQLLGQLQRPFFLLRDQSSILIASFAAYDRLQDINNIAKYTKSFDDGLIFNFDSLIIENISFSYNSHSGNIHNNLSLNINKGDKCIISGPTGCGKTTIFKLLLGFHLPDSGKIYFKNGSDTKPVSESTICNFSYVPQGNSLISGSIKYNMLLAAPNASDEDISNALNLACAEFVFDALPEGVNTVIGEKGHGLSEGQAQRIAIARGLLLDRPILLLDEPTAALDKSTAIRLISNIASYLKNKTVLIITHDVNIYRDFNNIYCIHSHQS